MFFGKYAKKVRDVLFFPSKPLGGLNFENFFDLHTSFFLAHLARVTENQISDDRFCQL